MKVLHLKQIIDLCAFSLLMNLHKFAIFCRITKNNVLGQCSAAKSPSKSTPFSDNLKTCSGWFVFEGIWVVQRYHQNIIFAYQSEDDHFKQPYVEAPLA